MYQAKRAGVGWRLAAAAAVPLVVDDRVRRGRAPAPGVSRARSCQPHTKGTRAIVTGRLKQCQYETTEGGNALIFAGRRAVGYDAQSLPPVQLSRQSSRFVNNWAARTRWSADVRRYKERTISDLTLDMYSACSSAESLLGAAVDAPETPHAQPVVVGVLLMLHARAADR